MYKAGVRWTEFLEPLSTHKAHLVPDNILLNHPYGYQDNCHDHPVTQVMLIVIIISQELGHVSFKKKAQLEPKDMVKINSLVISSI